MFVGGCVVVRVKGEDRKSREEVVVVIRGERLIIRIRMLVVVDIYWES